MGQEILENYGIQLVSDLGNERFQIRQDGVEIGMITLKGSNWVKGSAKPGVGFGIYSAKRGRGFAAKAVALITVYAFDKLGMDELIVSTSACNTSCQNTMAKTGYVPCDANEVFSGNVCYRAVRGGVATAGIYAIKKARREDNHSAGLYFYGLYISSPAW